MESKQYIGKSYIEALQELVKYDMTQEADEAFIKYFAREIMNLKSAAVVCGLVYPLGTGPAYPIKTFAQECLKVLEAQA